MSILNHINRRSPHGIHSPQQTPPIADVAAIPLPHATAVFGLSRSAIYRAAAEGQIKLVKLGRSTLVDAASARAFLASLPAAKIRRRPAKSA
ncbi:MAG: hypothetical protein DI601_20510 [Azospirillum brasilense]|jgi:predicted DNA-binding transcriptional regulator AlpA|nr:hypothetical protein [Roseomonas sp. DSM 102946]PZP41680.1 MAG: hypothetical protein DI601_20510 [Azospirillum brasilense]